MSDQPETLAAILAEMRGAAKSTDLFDGEEVGEPMIRGMKVEDWADRIEAAVEREREAYNKIIIGCEAMACDLAKERDRAVQYANAAPHPGSASWKEMQEALKTAERRIAELERAPGNAAAMRDALKSLVDFHDEYAANVAVVGPVGKGDRMAWCEANDKMYSAIAQARAALAAPARNCDVRDANDAWKDFLARGNNAENSASYQTGANAAIRWLYATAEGGAE